MIGVDEVGRGSWAGPLLVVAARQTGSLPDGLKDSKLLTKSQRLKLVNLLSNSCEFSEGWVSAREIDSRGLSAALRLGSLRALKKLRASVDETIILDGKHNYLPKNYIFSNCLVNADSHVPLVSAASIYAKVVRDKYMQWLSEKYPAYGFDKNVGYGTRLHSLALNTKGPLPGVHRLSFKPMAALST